MRPYRSFIKNHTISSYTPKGKKNKWQLESDDVLTLDIEVSSGFLSEAGIVIPYIPGIPDSEWNKMIPVNLCYIWQFSYNDKVYYGRHIEEFLEVLKVLPSDIHFIIWVHNLGYEFEFLQNILEWDDVFAREAHHPMKAVSKEFPNVEFRCSYILTRKSLDEWGKEMGFHKLHTLDYTVLRTPKTKLKQTEMDYCERDCQVVYKGICEYLGRYEHLCKIPLTQTGEIRKVVKKKVVGDKFWYNRIKKLIPYDAEFYEIFKLTFRGGDVAANYTLAGIIISDDESIADYVVNRGFAYDFASSYPFVMCSERYPVTPFVDDHFDVTQTDKKAYLMKVGIFGINAKTQNHYLSASKCQTLENQTEDNGRIISADYLETWITEQDYDIITRAYNYKSLNILRCYSSRKEYLPSFFIKYILELYANKTSLKGIKGQEELYGISKMFINALFGLCVCSVIFDDVIFNQNATDDKEIWKTDITSVDEINAFLKDLQKDYSGKYFLAFQWGLWITAYARHNLWECMLHVDEETGEQIEKSVIYRDTDSLKLIKNFDFTWYNDMTDRKLKEMCDCYNIDFAITRPKTKKGDKKPLGWFAREDDWTEFVTLGAKRYCYRDAEDGLLHLTVAGINKDAVLCLKDDIANFTEDFIFDKDFSMKNIDLKEDKILSKYYWTSDKEDEKEREEDQKRLDEETRGVTKKFLIHTRNMPTVIWNKNQDDEYKSTYKHGITMRPTGYSLGITDEYCRLIEAGYQNHLQAIDTGYKDLWNFDFGILEWDKSRY